VTGYYGEAPVSLGKPDLGRWEEFMHFLYLPVRIPERDPGLRRLPHDVRDPQGRWLRVPERLWWLFAETLHTVMEDAAAHSPHLSDPYVYVTARRGHASPGNPLNRPGWHCDDFGGTDLNYIWSDRWPTRFLTAEPGVIDLSPDDAESMVQMEDLARHAQARMDDYVRASQFNGNTPKPVLQIGHGPNGQLLRLSPYVVHDTPLIPDPGGMRSFFKISVSSHRYNLVGNSRNYLLDYDWPMHDRAAIRNKPGGNGDYYEETP
jgi:hypothetical protein